METALMISLAVACCGASRPLNFKIQMVNWNDIEERQKNMSTDICKITKFWNDKTSVNIEMF